MAAEAAGEWRLACPCSAAAPPVPGGMVLAHAMAWRQFVCAAALASTPQRVTHRCEWDGVILARRTRPATLPRCRRGRGTSPLHYCLMGGGGYTTHAYVCISLLHLGIVLGHRLPRGLSPWRVASVWAAALHLTTGSVDCPACSVVRDSSGGTDRQWRGFLFDPWGTQPPKAVWGALLLLLVCCGVGVGDWV